MLNRFVSGKVICKGSLPITFFLLKKYTLQPSVSDQLKKLELWYFLTYCRHLFLTRTKTVLDYRLKTHFFVYKDFDCPQVHCPRISYKSKVMVFWEMSPSTSFFKLSGRILINVLEANLYLALFLWSPCGISLKRLWPVR